MSDFVTNAELRIEAETLYDENKKLQAENATLRSCLSDDAENAKLLLGENRQLRELLTELYEDQCCDGDQWRYRDRMRELGIEVDG